MAEAQYRKGYPVFTDVQKYMDRRCRRTPFGLLKKRSEEHAVMRCLSDLTKVRTICDVPAGPGRLFPFWRQMGFRVYGLDISEPMVQAAAKSLRRNYLQGRVCRGDAFDLPGGFCEMCDLVVSVRFVYYFDRQRRVALLRSLADASRRYVLVQYKTFETVKGKLNLIRRFRRHGVTGGGRGKYWCSYGDIVKEIMEAGLRALHIVPISEFSDRVFVLAEKPDKDSGCGLVPRRQRKRDLKPGPSPFAAAVAAITAKVVTGLRL